MAEIINLRRQRKFKVRLQAASAADQNRIVFGMSKADRRHREDDARRATERLDGHRRVRPDDA